MSGCAERADSEQDANANSLPVMQRGLQNSYNLCRKPLLQVLRLTVLSQPVWDLHPGDAARIACKGVRDLAQYKGTVKWFNNAKGYGFLGRDGGADVFVHYTSIQREGYKSLKEGDEVEFDIIQGAKGPQADQVLRLKEVVS